MEKQVRRCAILTTLVQYSLCPTQVIKVQTLSEELTALQMQFTVTDRQYQEVLDERNELVCTVTGVCRTMLSVTVLTLAQCVGGSNH
jgi:hypothetical protein